VIVTTFQRRSIHNIGKKQPLVSEEVKAIDHRGLFVQLAHHALFQLQKRGVSGTYDP
jgi:hypothetical protein